MKNTFAPGMKLVGVLIAGVGSVGFLVVFLSYILNPVLQMPDSWEMPIPLSPEVLVSKANEVFVLTQRDARIQKYDATGDFVKGWEINPGGGLVCVSLANDTIHVSSSREPESETFDLNGDTVAEPSGAKDSSEPPVTGTSGCEPVPSTLEVRHQLSGWTVFPDKSKEVSISIRRKWWQYFAPSIEISFALVVIGTLLKYAGGFLAGDRKFKSDS